MQNIIFIDPYISVDKGFGLKAGLKKLFLYFWINVIRYHAKKYSPVVICTNRSTSRSLNLAGLKNIVISEYGSSYLALESQCDFHSLHQFVDSLYQLAKTGGFSKGLTYKELPLLKLIEARWIDPFFNNVLIYGSIVNSAITDKKPQKVLVLGRSSFVNLVLEISRAHGIKASCVFSFGFLDCLLKTTDTCASGYRQMVAYDYQVKPEFSIAAVSGKASKPKIVFLGGINRTVERLKAALSILQGEGRLELYLVAWRRVTLAQELKNNGVICSFVEDWISSAEKKRLIKGVGKAVKEGWRFIDSQSDLKLPHKWEGASIYKSAESFIKPAILEGSKRAALVVEVASRAIEQYKPDLVVSFEDGELNRAFTFLSRNKGIATLAYYTLSNNYYTPLIRRSQEWMAVSGETLYKGFLSQYPKDMIRIVGDTLSDRVPVFSRDKARKRICADLHLAEKPPIILLLSTYPAFPVELEDIRALFTATFEAARKIEGARVIVKAHPLQSLESLREWMTAWGCSGTLVQDCDLLELCFAADLISAPVTTAVWQAMMAGVPVVSIQRRELLEQCDLFGYGYLGKKGVVHISPGDDPMPIFKRLLFDPVSRQLQINNGLEHVHKHMGPCDGNSAKRLMEFITEIINQKPKAASNFYDN